MPTSAITLPPACGVSKRHPSFMMLHHIILTPRTLSFFPRSTSTILGIMEMRRSTQAPPLFHDASPYHSYSSDASFFPRGTTNIPGIIEIWLSTCAPSNCPRHHANGVNASLPLHDRPSLPVP